MRAFVVPMLLAAISFASPASAQSSPGKIAFTACAACHGSKPGEKRMGPTLAGVSGRKAGTLPGYTYSPAMAKSGIVWDDKTIAAYIANPKAVVPGTKMVFRGVDDPAKRQAIIGYLKSLPAK